MWQGKDGLEEWPPRPKTMEYVEKVMQRDSLWQASIDYQGNMPSSGRADLVEARHGYFAAWQIRRQLDMANMMSYLMA